MMPRGWSYNIHSGQFHAAIWCPHGSFRPVVAIGYGNPAHDPCLVRLPREDVVALRDLTKAVLQDMSDTNAQPAAPSPTPPPEPPSGHDQFRVGNVALELSDRSPPFTLVNFRGETLTGLTIADLQDLRYGIDRMLHAAADSQRRG